MNFIKITSDIFWGKDEITKDDLLYSDTVIDLQKMTTFNKDENKWDKIPHD